VESTRTARRWTQQHQNHGFCGFPSLSTRWFGRGAPQERQLVSYQRDIFGFSGGQPVYLQRHSQRPFTREPVYPVLNRRKAGWQWRAHGFSSTPEQSDQRLNASLTRLSSYRKCSKHLIFGRSAQATSGLRIEGTMKCSRIARGFGYGKVMEFAAEPSPQRSDYRERGTKLPANAV